LVPARRLRLGPWGRLVAVSTLVLAGGLVVLAGWGLASSERRIAAYDVRGDLSGVTLDLHGADAEIVGGGERSILTVRREERLSFGHESDVSREVSDGVLLIRSRCPRAVPASCATAYRLEVPDNVPVIVRTGRGDVSLTEFRGSARVRTGSGDISVGAFCGFSLVAHSDEGDVEAATTCPLERLSLRSRSGDVGAFVPRGRYRIEADSDAGSADVGGVTAAEDSPFHVEAFSEGGDVLVESRR
jgi:hypothetical protein